MKGKRSDHTITVVRGGADWGVSTSQTEMTLLCTLAWKKIDWKGNPIHLTTGKIYAAVYLRSQASSGRGGPWGSLRVLERGKVRREI